MLIAASAIVLFVLVSTAAGKPRPEHCPGAIRAVVFYRHAYNSWQQKMERAPVTDPIIWRCAHLRKAVGRWQDRAQAAHRRWVQEYDWQLWLPDKWQRVGACETGYGRRPGNWHHQNAGYVSAFGISRRAYDEDAAFYGQPPWNDQRNPTPHQQYLAALGHAHLHGGLSGWGCKAA